MAVKHLIFLGTKKDNHVLGALQTKCRTYFGCPKMIKSLTKLDFHVGHHNVILTLCEGSEMLTEWKSESITDGCPYGPNYVPTDGRT